jgi:hypothetical protein
MQRIFFLKKESANGPDLTSDKILHVKKVRKIGIISEQLCKIFIFQSHFPTGMENVTVNLHSSTMQLKHPTINMDLPSPYYFCLFLALLTLAYLLNSLHRSTSPEGPPPLPFRLSLRKLGRYLACITRATEAAEARHAHRVRSPFSMLLVFP